MIASLLTHDRLTLKNVPNLADVNTLARILRNHGVDLAVDGKRADPSPYLGETFHLTARDIVDTTAPYEMVSRMRASFWVLGPLLARCGEARVSMPGGCAIGTRPVDLHLMGLKALGAEIDIDGGYVIARAPRGLRGTRIVFPKVSVGATHAVLMAAALAKGDTVIENAAREPEIGDVADCLVKMGARIEGLGTSTLHIQGTRPDWKAPCIPCCPTASRPAPTPSPWRRREETWSSGAPAGACSRRRLRRWSRPASSSPRRRRGCAWPATARGLQPINIETQPFPGFPTDLQAQLMALMTRADGISVIRETIFENRFMHVQELARLGADIQLQGDTATIKGVDSLRGAPVMATDLRASVSLVIAGLMAEGKTTINRVYHLDRGFERLEQKLSGCGASIERLVSG